VPDDELAEEALDEVDEELDDADELAIDDEVGPVTLAPPCPPAPPAPPSAG